MDEKNLPTLVSVLRRAEKLYAGSVAVQCGNVALTYGELATRCRGLAGGLTAAGVTAGDRVATLLLNCHYYLEAYFAVPGLGAALVPLNNRHSLAEHCALLRDAGASVLLVDDAHEQTGAAIAAEIGIQVLSVGEHLSAGPKEVELGGSTVEAGTLAGLFYTSGTTGKAKGVMLSHGNLASNAQHAVIAFGLTDSDAYLHAAPMFHLADGTCTYGVTWTGGRHVIVPRFDPVGVVEAVAVHRPTLSVMVPTMLRALVDLADRKRLQDNSLRLLIHGGAPTSPELCRAAIELLDCSFSQVYGMTEAGPLLTVNEREETLPDEMLLSVGKEILGVEVEVVRPDGSRCDVGEIGEMAARGPNITAGYWNQPEETAKVLVEGWYRSGDLGYRDERGNLFIVDRAKDMIITGGENVYSAEVEVAVASHPAVREVAVIGIPDKTWGESIHAVVSLAAGHAALSLDELRTHLKDALAGYKIPKSMEIVEDLPKSGTGKILKADLRAPHWAGKGRNVN